MFTQKKAFFYDPIEDGTAEILRINADGSYNVISVNAFLQHRWRCAGVFGI
mgnify:CR=1 FL=1